MKKTFKLSLKILASIIALAIFVYLGSLVSVVIFSLRKNVPDHADAVMVLGAKVNLNDTPSTALYSRTMEAVALYNQNRANYFITTGGEGLGDSPEAQISAIIAEENGVPADKIISEKESHTTFENVQDVESQAKGQGIRSVIVVSDQYHVARGVLVAKYFGFSPVYWDYPDLSYYTDSQIIWNYAREAAAVLAYLPRMIIHN